jgi:DNA-binding response OmpR family regulator
VTRAKTIVVSVGLLQPFGGPLKRSGFEVIPWPDLGWRSLDRSATRIADLLIWNPSGAGPDVQEACIALRRQVQVPILALTAEASAGERVLMMEAGVDSCLTLPLHADELVARVRALLRRSGRQELNPSYLAVGDLEVDISRHEVRHRQSSIRLRPREFALVVELARHVNRVLSRELLLDRVWGLRGPYHRTVDVHIVHLRDKLTRAGVKEPRILTVRGVGYSLSAADQKIEALEKLLLTPMAWPWLGR